jgi:predicted Zn-dependent protease
VLQNPAVFVVIALVTGDVSSATAFGGALPTYLLQNRFSREFEWEADYHAVEQLRKGGIAPAHFAALLERLAATHGEGDSAVPGYLRTHPTTAERIQAINGR